MLLWVGTHDAPRTTLQRLRRLWIAKATSLRPIESLYYLSLLLRDAGHRGIFLEQQKSIHLLMDETHFIGLREAQRQILGNGGRPT